MVWRKLTYWSWSTDPVDPLFDELALGGHVADPVGFSAEPGAYLLGCQPAERPSDVLAAPGVVPAPGSVAASPDDRGDSIHWSLTFR